MAIDINIQFNGHNSYKVTTPVLCYPFGVQNMTYITHSFQAYANSPLASATRAKTKYFDADGAQVSEVAHAFAVTAVFGKVDITVAVPATATQAQLVLLQGGTDWWIAEPKSEQGEVSTPYNVNYAGQLTYITPNGIYTGMVTANQIVVAGSVGSPTEDLETRLVTINNNVISVSAIANVAKSTADGHESRITTIEAGQITLTSTVNGVVTKTTKITSAGVYTGEIVATQITSGYISANRIASGTITGTKIAGSTITGDKIAASTITGAKIAAGTITADKINVTNLYVDTVRGLSDSKNYAKFFASGDESSMTIYSPGTDGVSRRRGRIQTYGTTAISFNGYLGTWGSGTSEGVLSVGLLHGNAGLSAWNGSKVEMTFGIRRLGINSTGFYKDVDGVVTYF